MKKILLAVIFVTAFLSVGATAQGVYVPRPPVVYIPQLDPVRMHLEQQLFRDRMNAGGIVNGKKVRVPASNSRNAPAKAVKSITAFTPAGGRILPEQLSSAAGKSAPEIREAKQTFDMFLNNYEKTALTDGFPPNDLAYGFEFFIVNNYNIYNDLLYQNPAEKDLMKPSGNPLLALQHMYSKQGGYALVSSAENVVYQQIKTLLSANPEIIKLTDRQKQELTEMMVIITVTNYYMYETAGKNDDAEGFAQAQNEAKQSLEKTLGVSADKIKITANGLEFK